MGEDRTKPPPGYECTKMFGRWDFQLGPSSVDYETESEAIAAAWAHHDDLVAEGERSALGGVLRIRARLAQLTKDHDEVLAERYQIGLSVGRRQAEVEIAGALRSYCRGIDPAGVGHGFATRLERGDWRPSTKEECDDRAK